MKNDSQSSVFDVPQGQACYYTCFLTERRLERHAVRRGHTNGNASHCQLRNRLLLEHP